MLAKLTAKNQITSPIITRKLQIFSTVRPISTPLTTTFTIPTTSLHATTGKAVIFSTPNKVIKN